MAFSLEQLDHLVLTVASIEATIEFYTKALGMKELKLDGRQALAFGIQRINLHQRGHEFNPKAAQPTPGSADLCFITTTSLDAVIAHLKSLKISIEEGPVARHGAIGDLKSIYIRDPDRNLIEISNIV